MPAGRSFIVWYIDGEVFSAFLDAIRVVADPGVKHSAHVTLRGPYRGRATNPARFLDRLPATIEFGQIGAFRGPTQATVYLHGHSEDLSRLWWKPDYPNVNPHVTLYDGRDVDFSDQLIARTGDFFLGARCPIRRLDRLPPSRRQLSYLPQLHLDRVLDLASLELDKSRIGSLRPSERAEVTARLLATLAGIQGKFGDRLCTLSWNEFKLAH